MPDVKLCKADKSSPKKNGFLKNFSVFPYLVIPEIPLGNTEHLFSLSGQ